MSPEIESLSDEARLKILAGLAHELTICARDTYEVGTDEVRDPRDLRAYNELLHCVTASVLLSRPLLVCAPITNGQQKCRSLSLTRTREFA